MKKQEVSENELIDYLRERQCCLEKIIEDTSLKNQNTGVTLPGSIRFCKHGKGFQYYLRMNPKDTSGKYIRKEQYGLVRNTLQKEYNETIIQCAKKEIDMISAYINKTPPTKLIELYENLSEGRKIMIEPALVPRDEYVKQWEEVPYEGKAFPENYPEYYTQKGERVRSKSEVIIANLLNKFHVPYRYEAPITVKNLGKVYPDFTALNVRKRKEIYLEHLGMLDNSEYRDNAIRKITKYELDNIVLGDNLILTYETLHFPLNIPLLELKIQQFLL